jgi:hypothetical protein
VVQVTSNALVVRPTARTVVMDFLVAHRTTAVARAIIRVQVVDTHRSRSRSTLTREEATLVRKRD